MNQVLPQFLYEKEITLAQIKKEQNDKVIIDTNSSKVISKVQEILLKYIQNDRSKLYFQSTFYPTTNSTEIYRRQEVLQLIFQNELQKLDNLSELFIQIPQIRFPFSILTCDKEIYTNFEDKIAIQLFTEKELQEIEYQGDFTKETFVISNERYLGNIKQLRENELSDLITGYFNSKKIEMIQILQDNLSKIDESIFFKIKDLFKLKSRFNWNLEEISKLLQINYKEEQLDALNYIQSLQSKIDIQNEELKKIIQKTQLQLQGDDLIELLNSDDIISLKQRLQNSVKDEINTFEKKIREELKQLDFKDQILFSQKTYPLQLDEDILDKLYEELEEKEFEKSIDYYLSFSNPKELDIKSAIEYLLCYDVLYSIQQELSDSKSYPKLSDKLFIEEISNIFIKNATPISYALNSNSIQDISLNNERVSILTGANSGGKTTLLELILSTQYLSMCGFSIQSNSNKEIQIPDVEEIIYLKKFTGTQGSGAFEQTIKQLLSIISTPTKKLLLIDEFEAITEPGAAAKILITFLEEISKCEVFCVGVSHLGEDIKSHIENKNINSIRIDGISATGLDDKGNLMTNHQPQFNQLGSSTPELILQRIYQNEKFFKDKDLGIKTILEKMMNS